MAAAVAISKPVIEMLYVEDEEFNRDVFARILEIYNENPKGECIYHLTMAEYGQEGLDKYRAGHFGIVITDFQMPGALDGVDVVREIKMPAPPPKLEEKSASVDKDAEEDAEVAKITHAMEHLAEESPAMSSPGLSPRPPMSPVMPVSVKVRSATPLQARSYAPHVPTEFTLTALNRALPLVMVYSTDESNRPQIEADAEAAGASSFIHKPQRRLFETITAIAKRYAPQLFALPAVATCA
jgi:CheY-like chemotaxis protein